MSPELHHANGRANAVDELLYAGVRLIERGKPIIPCNGKVPCDDRGRAADAWQALPITTARLESGLAGASAPAIGMIMGPKSGIIDIETDNEHEVAAVAHLTRDVEMPIAPAYTTPKGHHSWYRWDDRLRPIGLAVQEFKKPGGTEKQKVKIRLGVNDAGAQSVIPPSEGREWLPGLSLDDVDPPALPELVIQRLLAAAHEEKPKRSTMNWQAFGVRQDLLAAIEKCVARMEDGNDGSKRLFTECCRGVELNGTDNEIVDTIRHYETKRPFPRAWSNAEIVQRIRDAENTVERGSEVVISNFKEVEIEADGILESEEKQTETITVPLSMGEIIDDINKLTGGWPERVDNMLFVDDTQHGLSYFDRRGAAGLFGWLRRLAKVKWAKGGSYVAQAELFAEIERTARRYDAIEVLPHEPPIAGIYYRVARPALGDGRHLRWLLDRFRPETTIDRDLIQAALMTLFWGGAPGRRPAFVITSDDGRGVGKTTVAEMAAVLCGGMIDVSAGENIQEFKTRLLTPLARTIRMVLLDNVKTLRLSWAELESMITALIISGRQLFVGEGQRPNLLTWFITLNGVSMATDMAQRSVIIKVVKGKNDGPWHEETTSYIDQHREQIIGDILAALQGERFELASYSRWATWERDVLCRLAEPGEAQRLIIERQGEANCEQDEAEIIEQHFAEQLTLHGYCANAAQVRIPVATAAYWYSKAVGEATKTAAASKRLHQMANEGQLTRITPDKSRAYGRGFVWTGPAADVLSAPIDNDLTSRIADYLNRQL